MVHSYAQKASCRNNIILRIILFEVFQSKQSSFTILNLIQYDQRFVGQDALIVQGFQIGNNLDWVDIIFEEIGHIRYQVQTYLDIILVLLTAEFLQDVGLAHLPGSLEDERLVVWPVLPVYQLLGQFSFHSIS